MSFIWILSGGLIVFFLVITQETRFQVLEICEFVFGSFFFLFGIVPLSGHSILFTQLLLLLFWFLLLGSSFFQRWRGRFLLIYSLSLLLLNLAQIPFLFTRKTPPFSPTSLFYSIYRLCKLWAFQLVFYFYFLKISGWIKGDSTR